MADTQPMTLPTDVHDDASKPSEPEYWAIAQSMSDPPLPPHMNLLYFCGQEVIFGRRRTSTFVIDHMGVSSLHCRIYRDPTSEDVFVLRDESMNGTYVGKTRVGRGKETRFHSGTTITILSAPDQTVRYRIIAPTAPSPAADNEPYLLGRELGAGAYARVLLASRRETGERFAAKVIDVQRFIKLTSRSGDVPRSDEQVEAQITAEVSILRKVRHPHIVGYHDSYFITPVPSAMSQSGRKESQFVILLDLLEHGDLLDFLINRGSPLSEPEARSVFAQLFAATAYLHSLGIVHRDIKPENILIGNMDPLEVKLSDFGLSRAVDARGYMTTVCGTPQYLAPEVGYARSVSSAGAGGPRYGQAVDFWSIGVILYIMLALVQPFDEAAINRTAFLPGQGLTGPQVEFPDELWAHISPEAKDLIRGLLSVDPTQRYDAAAVRAHPWLRQGLSPAELALVDRRGPAPIARSMEDGSLVAVDAPVPAPAPAPSPAPVESALAAAPGGGVSGAGAGTGGGEAEAAVGRAASTTSGVSGVSGMTATTAAGVSAAGAGETNHEYPGTDGAHVGAETTGGGVQGIVYRQRSGTAMCDEEPSASQLRPALASLQPATGVDELPVATEPPGAFPSRRHNNAPLQYEVKSAAAPATGGALGTGAKRTRSSARAAAAAAAAGAGGNVQSAIAEEDDETLKRSRF